MAQLSSTALTDRFRATLLGCAIGDALGFAYEGMPLGAVARRDDLVEDFAAKPRGRFAKGQFGENAAAAIAVAESLVLAGGVDGATIAAQLTKRFREGQLLGTGRAVQQALERVGAGTPWMAAGAPIGMAGCAAATRAPALGLWAAFEPSKLAHDAQILAVITHKDPRAAAGAAALAAAVAVGIAGEPLGRGTIRAATLAAASIDAGVAGELEKVLALLDWEEGPAALSIARLGGEGRTSSLGISTFVIPAVAFALFAAVHGASDFRLVAGACLRAGGDLDAVASMAGAIFGAHRGCDALPVRLRRGLREAARIVDCADQLLATRLVPAHARVAARRLDGRR